ncbi:hypothetical protein [Prosthecobacter sp.]|uniref:hypothetical protein n=1 Tax=Prosthecobacter sp. TaxID=1965333 RepID=UPI003783087C
MRPSTRILIGGVCMLVGMFYQHIPGMQGNPAWQVPMGILFVIGIVAFYLGCLRAARLAEKAYCLSKKSDAQPSQPAAQD